MGTRRRSRECALQILYGLDWTGADPDEAIELYWTRFSGERPQAYDDVRRGCAELVRGVVQCRPELDALLQTCSHNWKLDRMSVVDRNILRLGAWELRHRSDRVPRKVVLNEAIEIAKKFGSDDSSGFVNGILHQVSLGSEAAEADAATAATAVQSGDAPPSGADEG